MKEFEGKVVLVTGGTKGIGKAISLAFAGQGAFVVANYLSDQDNAKKTEEEFKSVGAKYLIHQADVRNHSEVLQMMQSVRRVFGKIDFLINNAGINQDKTLKNMTFEEWDNVITTNLTGVFNCCKAALDFMQLSESSRIVVISSLIAETGNYGQVNYAAAKAGLFGFVKSLALEMARSKVTVNAVAPGFTQTSMFDRLPETIKSKILEQIPLQRIARPEEIAQAVVYLCSPNAGYITGSILHINGGMHI